MIAPESTQPQREAIEHPASNSLVSIEGIAGSGKTYALFQRARRIAITLSNNQRVLVSSPGTPMRIALEPTDGIAVRSLADAAFEIVTQSLALDSDSGEAYIINDIQAAHLFERAAADLLSLE